MAIVIFTEAIKNRPKPVVEALLGLMADIIIIPDRNDEFVVGKDFAKYCGSNFNNWFIGKAEVPVAGAILRAQPLLQLSKDPAIIAELGGYLKARITLADIDCAKKSNALRKDCTYVGYIEDGIRFPVDEAFLYTNEKGEKCVLRAVFCYWNDDGWDVGANSVGYPHERNAGYWILSRNSVS